MPNKSDYDGIFDGLVNTILQDGYANKREGRGLAARANHGVVVRRNELTKDISKIWRDGYDRLKEENDQMQTDLLKSYKDAMQFTDEWVLDGEEGLQK